MIPSKCCTLASNCCSTHRFCHKCRQPLTDENRWNKDVYAAYCQTCWDKSEAESVPLTCEKCEEELVQDPEDLWVIECPNGCVSGRLEAVVQH